MEQTRSIAERYLDQSPACSWIIDPDYRFVRVYGDSVPVFGAPRQALEGLRMADALPAETASFWRERASRSVAGETLVLRERRPAGTWYIAQYPLRDPAAQVNHAAGFALDVTPWSTAEQELRHTVLGALRAQEFERNTMARFLHDTVGQNLSAAGLHLDLLRMDLEPTSPDACVRIAEIQQMLETMMQHVREYSNGLNPSMVDRAGLRPALDQLVGRYRSRFQGAVRLIFDPSIKISPNYATAMYQIAQESVENAVQHASCSVIEIAVKSTRTGPSLEIRDNGKGFDPADVLRGRRGLGLLTIEHFAAEAGLDVSISSTRDNGTVVRVSASESGK